MSTFFPYSSRGSVSLIVCGPFASVKRLTVERRSCVVERAKTKGSGVKLRKAVFGAKHNTLRWCGRVANENGLLDLFTFPSKVDKNSSVAPLGRQWVLSDWLRGTKGSANVVLSCLALLEEVNKMTEKWDEDETQQRQKFMICAYQNEGWL